MKAFLLSIAVLVIVSSAAGFVLGAFRESADMAYTTSNVRLN
jgi:cytochrome c-type biogenesis protein CcmE